MTKLKELVNYIQPSNYLVKSTNYSDEYDTPVLTPNKSFLLGYTNEENTFNRDCIIIDDFTLDVKYVDFPFMLKSSASKILVSDQMDLYYLYYLLKTYPFVLNGHGRHYISYVQEIEFDIPSLEEQEKIGSFFKELDELISDYQQIRQLWKESFIHYSNNFFPLHFDKYIRVEDVASERKEMDFSNDYNHLSLTIDGLIPKTDQYNRDFLMTDKENKKFKVTRINDICYNPANLKFNVITMNQIGTGIFSPIYVTLETKNIDKLYSKYLFTSKNFIKMARKYEEGTITERIGVKSSDFLKVKIIYHNPNEQEVIAKLLKQHEELLELYSDYIRLLEQTKKYYLNKIFN